MYRVIEELKKIPILHQADFSKIKDQLAHRSIPMEQRPVALARIVHQVLDNHLVAFPKQYRQQIKHRLLQQGITQGRFSFAADDVFISSLLIDYREERYFTLLTEWVNERQAHQLTKEQVQTTAQEMQKHVADPWTVDFATLSLPLTDTPAAASSNFHFDFNHLLKLILNIRLNPIIKLIPNIKLITNIKLIPNIKLITKIGLITNIRLIPSHSVAVLSLSILAVIIAVNLTTPATETAARATDLARPKVQYQQAQTLPNLPTNLLYKQVHTQRLQTYLTKKNSLLAQEPYFSSILKVSEEFNLNPLLLFAITGQEQGFVPRSHAQAQKIANNPYNVFHSWQEYNTDIIDSSQIAARTVINISKNRPKNTDPFLWINGKYAEDANWWKGVKNFYQNLEQATSHVGDNLLKDNP